MAGTVIGIIGISKDYILPVKHTRIVRHHVYLVGFTALVDIIIISGLLNVARIEYVKLSFINYGTSGIDTVTVLRDIGLHYDPRIFP